MDDLHERAGSVPVRVRSYQPDGARDAQHPANDQGGNL